MLCTVTTGFVASVVTVAFLAVAPSAAAQGHAPLGLGQRGVSGNPAVRQPTQVAPRPRLVQPGVAPRPSTPQLPPTGARNLPTCSTATCR